MQKEQLQPDVTLQSVFTDKDVINYAQTDNAHSFDLACEILQRQAKWENTKLVEVIGAEDMVVLLVLESGLEKLQLKYFVNEDPDEANILYRQPMLDIYDDDGGLEFDEIDNS